MSTLELLDTFVKNFNVNTDITDVRVLALSMEPYHSFEENHQFGEKKCLLYRIKFVVFNVKISLKILSFTYENYAEVLKLEIKLIDNDFLSTEIAPCKNFLQRKRNLNLTFEILIKCARLFEMRRLICQTIFRKWPYVKTTVDNSGVTVKCCSSDNTVKYLEFSWTISWNVEQYEVSDLIEFYCNHKVLKRDCGDQVKKKLEILVQPNFDFQSKLRLWKALMCDLYGCETVQERSAVTNVSDDVLEILDSDSDDSLIEVDRSVCAGPLHDEILVIE